MANDGRFVWHELRVPDPAAAARFYGELLGWSADAVPTGVTFRVADVPLGGASNVKPGIPSHWTPFVAVADVDAVARGAAAAGGIVTSGEPADVPGVGRLAPILDPHKAIFAVLRPLIEPVPSREVGAFVWARLRTPDVESSARFYEQVIGWSATLSPDGSAAVFDLADGTRVAEVLPATPEDPFGWLPFVRVGDLEEGRDRAAALGAAVPGAWVEVPGGRGRFSIIRDPQGAAIALLESS
jgi:uncharacterized protein